MGSRRWLAACVGLALAAAVVAATPTTAAASGTGSFEIVAVNGNSDGLIRAFRNVGGFNGQMFANPGVTVGAGWNYFNVSNEVKFADIDGDTWDDLIKVASNGEVWAWRNVNGAYTAGYTAGYTVIGTGWDPVNPDRIKFADLNNDRKHELINVGSDGRVLAWRNVNGLNGAYTAGATEIGQGWNPATTFFAEILPR